MVSPDDLVYYKSIRGKQKLAHNGYVYQKDKSREETCYWKCERRNECYGRLIIKEDIITKSKPHNHAPDSSTAQIQKAITDMKENISSSRETTSGIISRQMENVEREHRQYFPAESSLKRTLQRHRRKDQPGLPQSLDDIDITGKNF